MFKILPIIPPRAPTLSPKESLSTMFTLVIRLSLKSSFSTAIFLDLDGEVSGSSPGHTKDLKMVLTALQPVLVIMSLSIVNALAIKRRSSYLIQWTSRQRWFNSKRWLSDKIKGYKTYGPL